MIAGSVWAGLRRSAVGLTLGLPAPPHLPISGSMSAVIEFKPRRDDTLWAVVASIGRKTRVAEIFPSRERALADRDWREQQIRAYSSLFQSCRQPAPLYVVAPIRVSDLPAAWKPLPALAF